MSTRFSQWHNTEYVPLPVDYYMQAGLQNDQKIEGELQNTTAALASYKALQPIGADAQALHEQVLGNMRSDIEDVAKSNVKSPDAMMRLNSIIQNPTYIGSLSKIAKHAEYYKQASDAAKEYVKKYGNQVNAAPFYEQMQDMANEKGDPNNFNYSRFAGMDAVPAYIETQKEVDDVVSKMKPGSRVWDEVGGKYIVLNSLKELTPERIASAVQHEFRSRTDIKEQLKRNIRWDNLSSGQSMNQRAEYSRGQLRSQIADFDNDVVLAKNDPHAFMQKYGLNHKQDISSAVNELNNRRNLLQGSASLPDDQLIASQYINDAAQSSASVYQISEQSKTHKPDAFELQDRGFAHKEKMMKNMYTQDNMIVVPTGINGVAPLADEHKIDDGSFINELANNIGMTQKQAEEMGFPVIPISKKWDFTTAKSNPGGTAQWLEMQKIKNSRPSDKAYYVDMSKATPEQLEKLATSYGYNKTMYGNVTPMDFLKSTYRSNAHIEKGIINPNIDRNKLNAVLLSNNVPVYVDGVLGSDADKIKYQGMLNNDKGEKGNANFAKNQSGVIEYVGENATPVVSYNVDGKKVSFELQGDLGAGLSGLSAGVLASRNKSYGRTEYVDPAVVNVPSAVTNKGAVGYERWTASRLPNGPDITYFKGADSYDNVFKGHNIVNQVAQQLSNFKDLSKHTIEDQMKYINQAVKLINDKYEKSIRQTPNGISLDPNINQNIELPDGRTIRISEPIYIINKKFKNLSDYNDNIQVGISPQSTSRGQTIGGYMSASQLHDQTMRANANDLGTRFSKPVPSPLRNFYEMQSNETYLQDPNEE